jgi:hypothetical protein
MGLALFLGQAAPRNPKRGAWLAARLMDPALGIGE